MHLESVLQDKRNHCNEKLIHQKQRVAATRKSLHAVTKTHHSQKIKQPLYFCFTFSLSLYNDLKVLKTGGQPLLKFILRNLSKHSLNFSPWKKKILLTYIYPDNSNTAYLKILICTLIYLKPRAGIVYHNIIFIPLQLFSLTR